MLNQPVLVSNQIVDDIACSQGENRHVLIAIVLKILHTEQFKFQLNKRIFLSICFCYSVKKSTYIGQFDTVRL
jgi:hypothetical protein